jgi:ribose transport system substrate-binding protein
MRGFILHTLLASAALAAAVGAQAQQQTYKIALSNGWVGSEWRTQMIEEARAAAEAWKKRGVNIELVVQSKTMDAQTQISDVRNFINQGVNAILINPNGPTAFNPTFKQAKAAGITVIATDGEVTSPDALFVGIDQKEWAALSADWLAKTLDGKGNVVTINGIAGHPANQARVAGVKEVFAKYPNIKVLNDANADWDQAKAQQITQTLLATYPALNGIWVQDGEAEGTWRALEAAKKSDTMAATGELRASFVRQWAAKKWNAAASVNPPGCMASALNVAVLLLQGNKLKSGVLAGPNKNALYVPTKLITSQNVADAVKELDGKPDHAFVSLVLSPEEVKQRFFQ